ncbi:trypsin iota [Drosophila tropicalis]|uniref:trypsin iota n=1 Tax=Drosophila tropicalis TaxID=46794 RepID=UPI0035AC1235
MVFSTVSSTLLLLLSLRFAEVQGGVFNERIVGGDELSIHNSPWQVSIQISARHECGGVIYSPEIILTAAHCVEDKSTTLIKVRVGANQHNSGGTLIPVTAYKIHEKYDSKYLHYDIAVVRLSETLTFSLNIKAINLASESPVGGSNVSVTGWGSQQEDTGYSGYADSLQTAELKIIEREECASTKYGYGWDFVGEEMICAAASSSFQQLSDACAGDSGGPLTTTTPVLLVGLVSWGYGCGQVNYPGVYIDVAILRPWIVKAANAV